MKTLAPDAEAELAALIRHEVRDKAIPSISWVLAGPEGCLSQGHVGLEGTGRHFGEGTLFRIGSLTKTFTAIAVMQQVEKRRIDLDVDIATYLPGFRPENPWASAAQGGLGTQVTLRKLLSHTAGMAREAGSGHYLDSSGPALSEIVAALAEVPLKHDPSAGVMRYSNAGFAIVSAVLEAVTGLTYADYAEQNIFRPLGLGSTFAEITPGIREALAPARMWTLDGDTDAPVFNLGGPAAGNIVSNTSDMAEFMSMILRGGYTRDGARLLSPKSLREMSRNVGRPPLGATRGPRGYGLGLALDVIDDWTAIGHGGAVYGYATQLTLLPEAGLGVTIFSTLDFTNQIASRLATDALRIGLSASNRGRRPQPPAAPPAIGAAALEALPGTYRHAEAEETVEIVRRADRLYLSVDDVPLRIRPAGGDRWIIDGRIHGRGSSYEHLDLAVTPTGALHWKDAVWIRAADLPDDPPPDIAPHLGTYGPAFNPVHLFWRNGTLKCRIEQFFSHDCLADADGVYRLHGPLYDAEVLTLGARDEAGDAGIQVGPMVLKRRSA